MIKRTVSILTAIVMLMCAFVFTVNAESVTVNRGVNVYLPKVTFELSGNHNADDISKATLNNRTLNIDEANYASTSDKELVYIMVDTSSAMKNYSSALSKIKTSLKKFIDRFDGDDEVVLYTFNSGMKKCLNGNESNATRKSQIDAIAPRNTNKSCLYRTLRKVYDKALNENDFDRKYGIVISDGVDNDPGDTNSYEKISELYKSHSLPLYGICLNGGSKASYSEFSTLCKRGGVCNVANNTNASNRFDKLQNKIKDVTIFKCTSDSNSTKGGSMLVLSLKDSTKITTRVYVKAEDDSDSPRVKKISYDFEKNSIVINFSENVMNAGKSASYKILASDGSSVAFETPIYESNTAVLHLVSPLYSGDYTFEFHGIYDTSDNKNPLVDKEKKQHIEAHSFLLEVLKIVGFIMIPVAFLVALFLILLFLKKKKNVKRIKDIFITQVEEVENEQIHIEQPKGRKLNIFIYEGNRSTRRLDYNLMSSMIVGRSSMCDLAIDDSQMSRQHFVVEDVETGLAVTDLGTTNGTNINGVPIMSRTFLNSGDKITAGTTTITISYTR